MTDPNLNPAGSGAAAPAPGSPPRQEQKQAVVLVHGMGEQVPMETLRGFVETMWVRNGSIEARWDTDPPDDGNPIWWKPDFRTGSPELSRITTRGAEPGNRRTDFYELYWADLTASNTVTQLKDWFMSLLLRSPYQVPPEVVWVWLLLWTFTIAFAFLGAWKAATTVGVPLADMPRWANWTLGIGTAVYTGTIGFVLAYFGDVARYVRAKPPNIAARREIRERGLALLRTLRDDGQYKRIVLVSHSLGTIVAYDILRTLWVDSEDERKFPVGNDLYRLFEELEAAAKALPESPSEAQLAAYSDLQAKIFDAMQVIDAKEVGRDPKKKPWPISDFVTVGSPLSHAQFLMARDDAALQKAAQERRYPTSPPQFDDERFVFPVPGTSRQIWCAHHAALFAAVRWTNIYDPAGEIRFLRGDMISGSVRRNFGQAILEVPIEMRRSCWPHRLFTHTQYWTNTSSKPGEDTPQVVALRKALDLLRP